MTSESHAHSHYALSFTRGALLTRYYDHVKRYKKRPISWLFSSPQD